MIVGSSQRLSPKTPHDHGLRKPYAAGAAASSSVKPRVLFGSTGMPGPIVVVNVTFYC